MLLLKEYTDMLLSKEDTNFFIQIGTFNSIITEITKKNNPTSSLEYCNGYNTAINDFVFTFKKQYNPAIKYKINKLAKLREDGEICYFAKETNPYKWTKVDNRLLSDAMCEVLHLIYFNMLALNKTEYRKGYHKAVIDIAEYCGLRELEQKATN